MSRYKGPIIDAHHHFWEPSVNKQPWLMPGVDIGFRYGNYESIKHSFLPPDLLALAGDLPIVGSVTMETEWREDDLIGEMIYMRSVRERFDLPDACAARVILNSPEAESSLERLRDFEFVKSIRHKPEHVGNSLYRTLLEDPAWQAGVALCGKYGFAFELQVAWKYLGEAVDLFARYPDIQVLINHAGLPSDRSDSGLKGWSAMMEKAALLPNMAVKISGIGVPNVPWTTSNNHYIVQRLGELFGEDRIMFASNFPVDSLCGTYQNIWNGFLDISEEWPADMQKKAFFTNAIKFYSLGSEVAARKEAPAKAFASVQSSENFVNQKW